MNDIILHHYPASPFAEKIRLILGAKGLAWRSVTIPWIMPKPDLMPLTGGYRRTPVLQIGADIYCDTALIARVLDARAPQPPLYPANRAAARSVADLADRELFGAGVAYVFQPAGFAALFQGMKKAQIDAFVEDRKTMRAGGAGRMAVPEAAGQLHGWLHRLTDHLADGRPFLVSDAPTIADFSAYHPLWFVRRAPALAPILAGYPAVAAWFARIGALGHGESSELDANEALAIAAAATPADTHGQPWVDYHGCQPEDEVEIEPADYGIVPVRGHLVVSALDHLAVRRSDPRSGEVVVHFPRIGYRMRKVDP
ncbi:MAG: glutathione S-transferase family protein [Burkholderiaceae bacterium]|nr:glutathione S-transferase family protein [Burkholderiaceae bacterium]